MGIYDQLSNLDKKLPTSQAPEVKSKKLSRGKISAVKNSSAGKNIAVPPHHHATTAPLDVSIPDVLRESVKEYGTEKATYRLTAKEKKALMDIIYAFRDRGIRVSENYLVRIAVNSLVHEFRLNGENSVLTKVLKKTRKK